MKEHDSSQLGSRDPLGWLCRADWSRRDAEDAVFIFGMANGFLPPYEAHWMRRAWLSMRGIAHNLRRDSLDGGLRPARLKVSQMRQAS